VKKEYYKYIAIALVVVGLFLLFSPISIAEPQETIGTKNTYEPLNFESKYVENIKPSMIFTDINPNQLDQKQEEIAGVVPYIHAGQKLAQGVTNDREPLYGVAVQLKADGEPNKAIYLGIMKTLKDPRDYTNFDRIGGLQPSNFACDNEWHWVLYEFDNSLDVSAGETFYIVIFSENTPDANQWVVAGSSNNPYSNVNPNKEVTWKWYNIVPGMIWEWMHWEEEGYFNAGEYDLCFKTYTSEDEQEEPPQVSINVSTSIITQSLGLLSLIGAALSGTRYFMF
jgi:hypothetical protein